jgi:hypothetical protein
MAAAESAQQYEVEYIISRDDETNTYQIKWVDYDEPTYEPIKNMINDIPQMVFDFEYKMHTIFVKNVANMPHDFKNLYQLIVNHYYKAPKVLGFLNDRLYFMGRETGIYCLKDNGYGGSSVNNTRLYIDKTTKLFIFKIPEDVIVRNYTFDYERMVRLCNDIYKLNSKYINDYALNIILSDVNIEKKIELLSHVYVEYEVNDMGKTVPIVVPQEITYPTFDIVKYSQYKEDTDEEETYEEDDLDDSDYHDESDEDDDEKEYELQCMGEDSDNSDEQYTYYDSDY